MSDGGLTVLDGSQLSSADVSLPSLDGAITGAQLLEIADSRASESLLGVALPENLKSSAFHRLGFPDDHSSFVVTEFDREMASSLLRDYVNAMADELRDDPLVVAILDGRTLRLMLEDEDDFAILAENLFTDLDTEDNGKIKKQEIQNALLHMGIEMGIPPFPAFPQVTDILQKHIVEGEEEVGQAQFAKLLQPVLQEVADALALKSVVVVQNIKILNGSKLRKLLVTGNLLDVAHKIMLKQDKEKNKLNKEMIRAFLEENGTEYGLPSLRADDMVVLLYDAVFADIEDTKNADSEENLTVLLKEILEKFQEQLEANPVFYDAVP